MRSGVSGRGTPAAETVEFVGNTHLIEIGITGKRQKAGMLGLPAESPNSQCVVGLNYRYSGQSAPLGSGLCRHVVLQRLICDAFHKAVAKSAEHDPEGPDIFGGGYMLHDIRVGSSGVYQLAAGIVDESGSGEMAGPEFHLLAEGARINSLVAGDASHVVVSWAEPIVDSFFLFEDELVVLERAIASRCRWYRGPTGGYDHAAIAEIVE
jgi:hypothetical protein